MAEKTKAEKRSKSSALEDRLYAQMIDLGLEPVREYVFSPDRRWRADFAFPPIKVIVEVEGGLFGKPIICDKCGKPVARRLAGGRQVPIFDSGRHNSGAGYEKDLEKYNTAAVEGWIVVRVSSSMIRSGEAIKIVQRAVFAGHWRMKDD